MKLLFQKIGDGSKILLAFHGIGQDFSCFAPFAKSFSQTYTCYLFDLPFHGKNQYHPHDWLTLQLWQQSLGQFLTENHIERFSVMGFSMGGRFALATFATCSGQIDDVVLIAPDGIKQSLIYRLATHSSLGRAIFRRVIGRQKQFQQLGRFMQKMGFINKSVLRLAENMLGTPRQQQLIYQSWVGFHRLAVKVDTLVDLAEKTTTQFHFFVGKYDSLLPPNNILPLSKQLTRQKTVILEVGHTKIVEKVHQYYLKNGIF